FDLDESLMSDALLVDDVDVALVEDLKGSALGDDHAAVDRSVYPQGSCLAVAQEALRIWKVGAEGDVARFVVKVGLDGDRVAGGMFEERPVGELESETRTGKFQYLWVIWVAFLGMGLEVEVVSLRHI